MKDLGCKDCGRVALLQVGRCAACRAVLCAVSCAKCGIVRRPQRRFSPIEAWCGTCCKRDDSANARAAVRSDVIRVLKELNVDPVIGGAAFDAVVGHRDVALLATAIRDDDVFNGSTSAPLVVDRLIAVLRLNGATTVAAPGCMFCGGTHRLRARFEGRRICEPCAHVARASPCTKCAVLVVRPRHPGEAVVCVPCRATARAARVGHCVNCGQERHLVRRHADRASRQLCADCVPATIVDCSVCGLRRAGNSGARSGRARCNVCASPRATCSVCHSPDRVIEVKWASGPVCRSCRAKLLARRSSCVGCGHIRRIDPRNTNGHAHCSTCAGLTPFNVCRGCGIEDRLYRGGRCFACVLDIRLDELLAENATFEPFRLLLRDSRAPRTVLRWLSSPVVATTIAAMTTTTLSLSHATLDDAGPRSGVAHLRAVLVEAGILEPRDEATARLEAFVDAKVRSVERAEDRKMIEAFGHWHVLRRYRHRVARYRGTRHPVDTGDARNDVHCAISFLDWLHEHNITLATCTQHHVDKWVTSGPAGRRFAKDFVRWAVKRRLATGIDIKLAPRQIPARTMSSEQLTVLVRRFLTDDTIRLPERVAGLLVMCFAQSLSRIVRLRRSDIESSDGHEWVRFGATPIELPDPIGIIVRMMCDNGKGRATSGAAKPSPWLFPGGHPGRPIGAQAMAIRLNAHGINAKMARTTAMLDLAAELPPAVLADMIGLVPNTAVRWVHAAGGDWTTYVAERTRGTAT